MTTIYHLIPTVNVVGNLCGKRGEGWLYIDSYERNPGVSWGNAEVCKTCIELYPLWLLGSTEL